MAITTMQVELQGELNGAVASLRINGTPVPIVDQRFVARLAIPETSTSVTLVATMRNGSQRVRRLLIGKGGLPMAGVSA